MRKIVHSLSFKVLVIFLSLTVGGLAVLDVLAFFRSDVVFQKQASASMESVLTFRGDMLRDALHQLDNGANSIARIEALQLSMSSLKSGWKTIEKTNGSAKDELIREFITNNPNPENEREKLIKPAKPSGFYYSTHEQTQKDVAADLADTQFSDLLMADVDGNVFYSYRKQANFAQNIVKGPLAASGIGVAFSRAAENAKNAKDDVAAAGFSGLVVDQETGKSAVYFAVPVLKLGANKGYILVQVSESALVAILSKGHLAGSSQQTYIFNNSGNMIGLDSNNHMINVDATAFSFAQANIGSDGMSEHDFDRVDGKARAYMRSIDNPSGTFLIVETVLQSELNAGSEKIALELVVIGFGVLVVLCLVTVLFTRTMFSPLIRLASSTRAVAAGELEITIHDQSRNDEIGTVAKSLEQFRQSLQQQWAIEAENIRTRQEAEVERAEQLQQREREARSLQNVVSALDEGLQNLVNGNLGYRIEESFPAELDVLRGNFNMALKSLQETMATIGKNSDAVRNGSDQMRDSADALAERTVEQSASITQTAHSISSIARSVREQIGQGENAAEIAKKAKAGTLASGKIMQDTISAIEAIQGSSREINQIISVIGEIAFQTNLLALNAGVEAARAGESGRGFAVVAQEVRELALRSSNAAKEITSLLQKSTSEVETGVALVTKAGQSLKEIDYHVEGINEQLSKIMTATREDAQTLAEISSSMAKLDEMTQQNGVMVQTTTVAIHRLAEEAVEMDERLGHFEIDADATNRRPAAPTSYRYAS